MDFTLTRSFTADPDRVARADASPDLYGHLVVDRYLAGAID